MKVGRKKRTGEVVKESCPGMVIVRVVRTRRNPILGKVEKIYKKYKTHDELTSKLGDFVEIEECRPLSRMKKWRVIKVLEKSKIEKIELKDELEELKPKEKIKEEIEQVKE